MCLKNGLQTRNDRMTGQARNAVRAGLDSQALTALGAACVDDRASTACLHANQKTVGTGTADLGGLVSAFHNILESLIW